MKKQQTHIKKYLILIMAFAISISFFSFYKIKQKSLPKPEEKSIQKVDLSKIPNDKFGVEVRYGRELMLNTAFYIGPDGIKGKYLGNKMNCTNCHQDAGTKAFSFNLMSTFEQYPQYRPREGKVLTLAERINNCIERPHNGRPLPLDSREMVAFLSYLKWINGFAKETGKFNSVKNLEISFPPEATSSERGSKLFAMNCQPCHGSHGEGMLRGDSITYAFPPLWGEKSYQPGSSMHRIIKMAQWIKGNMPYGKATWDKPFLTDEQALDLAAFVNDDLIHKRPTVKNYDYPHPEEKAIDYDKGPFIDTFSVAQHKFGPYQPIISFWKNIGRKPAY
jgi:thiosulfate dehydrogenase